MFLTICNAIKMENPGDKVEQIQAEALSLFKRKNEQYGMLLQNMELLEL